MNRVRQINLRILIFNRKYRHTLFCEGAYVVTDSSLNVSDNVSNNSGWCVIKCLFYDSWLFTFILLY